MSSKDPFVDTISVSGWTSAPVGGPTGVPEQGQIINKEDQGSGACSCLGHPVLRIFEAQKLLDVTEANFQRQRREKVSRICAAVRVRSREKKQSSRRRPLGSCTTTMRRSCWPALGYHKASMVWYQSLTCFP